MNSSSQWHQDTCLGMLGPQVLPGQSPGPPLGAVTSLWDGPWEVPTESASDLSSDTRCGKGNPSEGTFYNFTLIIRSHLWQV